MGSTVVNRYQVWEVRENRQFTVVGNFSYENNGRASECPIVQEWGVKIGEWKELKCCLSLKI